MPAPSIKFIDSLVGPSAITKQWRDLVGVIGTFSRGPETPVLVEDIKTFASIFGVDSSSGSLFVQQAMANGLNRFVVVRASASSNTAESKITFTSGDSQISPVIGYIDGGNTLDPSPDRTTGLKLEFNYIGKPIVTNPIFATVDSRRGQVNLPNFNGQARFNFFVTKAVEGRTSTPVLHDTTKTIEIDTILSPNPNYFVGLIAKTAANYSTLKEYIRPGYSLTTTLNTAPETVVSDNLLLASDIISNYSLDYDAILVKSDKKHSHAVWGVVSGKESGTGKTLNVGLIKVRPRQLNNSVTITENYVQENDVNGAETKAFIALKDMILLIDGVEYTQNGSPVPKATSTFSLNTAVNTEDGLNGDLGDLSFSFDDLIDENLTDGSPLDNIEGTRFEFTLSSTPPVIQGGSTVTFLPKVSAANGTTSVTITGLYSTNVDSGVTADTERIQEKPSSYYVVIDKQKYLVSAANVVTGSPHQLTLTLDKSCPANAVNKAVYIYYKSVAADSAQQKYQIRAPKNAQYVIGYNFDSQSGSIGSDYFTLKQNYNNINVNVGLDNTFLLTDKSGGRYITFGYYTKPSFETDFETKAFPLLTKGFGIELFFGTGASQALPLAEGGSFAVPFAKTSITLGHSSPNNVNSFQDGDLATEIIKQLETALRSNSIISSIVGDIKIEDSILVDNIVHFKPTITLTSLHSGQQANRISWNLTRYATGNGTVKDLLLGVNSTDDSNYSKVNYFTGGYNGASFAFRDLYSADGTLLWRIQAVSPGVQGNNISCTVRNQRATNKVSSFELEVLDLNTTVISSDSKVITTVTTANLDFTTGRSLAFSSTSLVQVYFMPVVNSVARNISLNGDNKVFSLVPQRLAPPLERISANFSSGETGFARQGANVLTSFKLRDGVDSTLSTPTKQSLAEGLLKGIKAIKGINIATLALPGIFYGDSDFDLVFEKAVDSLNESTPESGLRTAVFDLAPDINPDRARILSSRLDNERVVLVAGTQLMRGSNGLLVPNVGSSGSYIGYDLSRAPNISPAASYEGALVKGITSIDTITSSDYLDKMSDAGVEVLLFDANIGGYRFCNGLTTSSQIAKRYRSIIRTLDQVKTDLYLALQWCRSRPNTPSLQSEVASACDTYLYTKLRDGWFTNLQPTICSEANNTLRDQLEGKLNIRIRFTPTFPADTIIVSTIMDISDDLTIQTSV